MKASKRINLIYSLCRGDFIWDICCDHSQVALINLKQKKFKTVYCVDKSKDSLDKIKVHPIYQAILKQLETPEKMNSFIQLIYSDGTKLNWDQVSGSVIIAGVGSHTLISIIKSCPLEIRNKLVWVLNPFNHLENTKKELGNLFPSKKVEELSFKEGNRERPILYVESY